jgi:PAS domain S-box-containing protein
VKILSVDDNAENRYLIEAVGRAHGFEVVSARNGREALEKLDSQPVDLIVSDVLMPEMDGFQLCHELRSREHTRHIPFIFYTATYTARQDAELGLSLGASRYVLKPVDLIVSDVLMPEMDGFQFCREVKSREHTRHIPFIFYTATYTSRKDAEFGMSLGASRFVLKPVDPDEFMTIIGEVLSEAQQGELAVPEAELKGATDYLEAYNARLVHKLNRKIEQLEAARNELHELLAARDSEIAQRKRAEEALAMSESRLRALLESASQGVVAVDKSGHMVLVNTKTEEMFGYTRDELLGQPLDIMLPERYRTAHAEHLQHYFAHPHTRVMGLGLDLYGRSKNGNEFPLEITLSCAEHNGSRLAMALITDITERKKVEDRLWQAQKLESIGLLAGGIAHDFNNLLVGVIGNASMAQELLPLGHDAGELLQRVLSTGEQLAHLTRQMLAYSGKGRFVFEPLSLSDLIPEMSSLVQPSISKKIALHFGLEPDLPLVEADRGQMQQVVMNLLLNAAEAIGSNAGLISVKTGFQVVDEAYIRRNPGAADLRPGKYVRLKVRDTGCGMDEATKARIFDPFFTTKFTGRGLGLAAVAGIVRGHKGSITVSSTPGKGSCFTVLFPAGDGAAAVSPVVARDADLHGAGTILVVDDEEAVRVMAEKALERYGYKVLVADCGLAAIDVCRRHPGDISLVVLDLSMPGMAGEEALPELRKIRPNVKIVVSSGYSETETMRLFAGQRVSGFLQKPFTSTRLAAKVKRALG